MTHCSTVEDTNHTYLECGIAISPLDAAICIDEYMRTTKYIIGIFEAIADLMTSYKGEKIHLLYAGSGPYGTLLVPILSFFDSKRLAITFLDIHKLSLDSVKNIVDCLELENYICEYIQDDATKYKSDKKLDIVVTETMKAAFDNEPQVAISLNLLPQLCEDGIFIPNKVVVNFEMIGKIYRIQNNSLNIVKESKVLCEVIGLDSSKQMTKENLISNKSYTISEKIDEKMEPFLTTKIYIYKENILDENECSLNIPKKIDFDKILSNGDCITFNYNFDSEPKIDFKLQNSQKIEGRYNMLQKQNFIKLPFEFDVKKLNEDLSCVDSSDWVNHPNVSAYDGSWLITSLTSTDGKTKQIMAVENQDYINTPLLQKTKYIKDVINIFQTKVEAVRFMKLGANSIIKTHRDRGSHYNDGLARIHIPITTNNDVEFILNGQKTKMDIGKCYYIDADAPHSVVNNGDSDRVHLLIDCHINNWFKTIFKEANYIEKKYKYINKNINDDNVDDIIESLISINTDTSLLLAKNLKKNQKMTLV